MVHQSAKTAIPPTPTYGPYANAAEASICIQTYLHKSFPPNEANELGIIWLEPQAAAVLRQPTYHPQHGIGASILVQYHGPIPPRQPVPPSGIPWHTIDSVVRDIYGVIGTGLHDSSRALTSGDKFLRSNLGPFAPAVENLTGMTDLLTARDAWRFVEKEFKAHPEAAAIAATVLDAVGVIGGVIGVGTLLSTGGVVVVLGAGMAMIASGILFVADGQDARLLVNHDDAAAAKWEDSAFFRRTELLAPLFVLPDAARAGMGVTREVQEGLNTVNEAKEAQEAVAGQHELIAERLKKRIEGHGNEKNLPKKEAHRISNMTKRAEIAAKRLKAAEDLRLAKENQLRLAILKSIRRDGPGLMSAAGGTTLYAAHLPDLVHQSHQPKPHLHSHHRVHQCNRSHPPLSCLE